MKRSYMCGFCYKKFDRNDILPPIGATRPPGEPWRCKPCHREHILAGFHKVLGMKIGE